MIFGSSCFHEVFSDPPKMNSSSLYHFSKFLSLLYFSAVRFARPVVQLICKSNSCLLKWMCNVLKFHTLYFVVLMRFVAGQSGNCSYALLTLPAIANLTPITKLTPSKQNIPTPTPSHLTGDINRVTSRRRWNISLGSLAIFCLQDVRTSLF